MSQRIGMWKMRPIKDMSHEELCEALSELIHENLTLRKILNRERQRILLAEAERMKPWYWRILGL